MREPETIAAYHIEGLARIASIIDGNPSYDVLMQHKFDSEDVALFDDGICIERQRDHALRLVERKFGTYAPRVFVPSFAGIACEGATHNNLREFAFFERICARADIRISAQNYAKCPRRTIADAPAMLEPIRGQILEDAAGFYREREAISLSLVHQQILYSQSFLSFVISFCDAQAVLPSALVQANDHSPVRVALSMVMKGFGIPRIYLQHAEITEAFPPLDFEYSVLRNRHSLDIYLRRGPATGKTFVIPRAETTFSRERLIRDRGDRTTVVIYPTSRVLVDATRQMIEALKRNPYVESIVVKTHPGEREGSAEAFSGRDVRQSKTIPSEDHVAIVGNSSVAIELLHQGIPIYQYFGTDPVVPDYYGFAAQGLTKAIETEDLGRRFWTPYAADEKWLDAYSRWDPSADAGSADEEERFVEEMAALAADAPHSKEPPQLRMRVPGRGGVLRLRLQRAAKPHLVRLIRRNRRFFSRVVNFITANSGTTAPPLRQMTGSRLFIERTLTDLERPARWIEMNDEMQLFPCDEVIGAVEQLFQERHPIVGKIFADLTRWPGEVPASTWAYLKRAEWGNIELPLGELGAIARYIYSYRGPRAARGMLERSLMLSLLRTGSLEDIDEFFAKATRITIDRLSIRDQTNLLRRVSSDPGRSDDARELRARIEGASSRYGRLRLNNMDALAGNAAEGWNHASATAEFTESAPPSLAGEYEAHLAPAYEKLKERLRFMDVRTNAAEASAISALITQAIEHRQPFSLVRLSDGEGYLFPEQPFFTTEDSANRERHWWGEELPADLRNKVITMAKEAVGEADVLGIPALYRFIRDHGDNSTTFTKSIQGRGLMDVLMGIDDLAHPDADFAEDKVNVSLFPGPEQIAELTQRAQHIVLIGSIRRENLPAPLSNDSRLSTIPLPTHARTRVNDKYHTSDTSLPFILDDVLAEIDRSVGPGTVVLVAGGIVGKIFVGRARRRGAVSLDIGSVLDDWAHGGLTQLR